MYVCKHIHIYIYKHAYLSIHPPNSPRAPLRYLFQEPATQEALASLSLKPKNVRELFEGAAAKKRAFAPVPPAALAKLKFKLHAHKSFSLLWSSKGSDTRDALTLWAPDVDDRAKLGSAKRSRFRVCLGHYACGGADAPGRGARVSPLVLEVSDTSISMGLSASEHLAAVVEQLLPPPLRFRLAWASEEKRVWIWRAVPPGGSFLALGMVVTRSEEPPPPYAMCCVPRRWCVRDAEKPKFVWRDAGGSGRPGSFWSTGIQQQLMLAHQGHDPPPPDAAWRFATDRWYAVPEKLRDLIEQHAAAAAGGVTAGTSFGNTSADAGPMSADAWLASKTQELRARQPPPGSVQEEMARRDSGASTTSNPWGGGGGGFNPTAVMVPQRASQPDALLALAATADVGTPAMWGNPPLRPAALVNPPPPPPRSAAESDAFANGVPTYSPPVDFSALGAASNGSNGRSHALPPPPPASSGRSYLPAPAPLPPPAASNDLLAALGAAPAAASGGLLDGLSSPQRQAPFAPSVAPAPTLVPTPAAYAAPQTLMPTSAAPLLPSPSMSPAYIPTCASTGSLGACIPAGSSTGSWGALDPSMFGGPAGAEAQSPGCTCALVSAASSLTPTSMWPAPAAAPAAASPTPTWPSPAAAPAPAASPRMPTPTWQAPAAAPSSSASPLTPTQGWQAPAAAPAPRPAPPQPTTLQPTPSAPLMPTPAPPRAAPLVPTPARGVGTSAVGGMGGVQSGGAGVSPTAILTPLAPVVRQPSPPPAAPGSGDAAASILWWTQTLQAEGIVLPGPSLQLGFKTEIRPPNGRLGIYFGNLSQQPLSLTSCSVAPAANGSAGLIATAAPGPTAVPPRGQALMMVTFEHRAPFAVPPALSISLAGCGASLHKLPILPHRFLLPWPLPSADAYFSRWRVPGLAETQASFVLSGPYDRLAAARLLSAGAGLAILDNVDPVPSNLVAAGYLVTTSVGAPPDKVANPDAAVFCLVRLEVNPQRGAARLTARSKHAPLAEGLVRALAASWGNVAAPIP